MGASESTIIIEQDVHSYLNQDVVKSYSTDTCQDVLKLYKINREERSENFVEDNLLNNDDGVTDDQYYYVIILMNQNNTTHCFNIARFDSLEIAEEKFSDLKSVLFPFIDDYPSVQCAELLMSYLKLKKAYPNWKDEKHAEYLKLPEVKLKNTKKVLRQSSQIQEETYGLVLKEQPSFAKDLFGTLPVQFFSENHPELFESVAAAIDSLHKTGRDLKDSIDGITKYTESPIHVAIRLSQEVVLKLLLEKGVNHLIPCGHAYPVHLAMKHESLGCLKLLLEHDAQSLMLQDKKYLGSLLHWAKNTDQIDIIAAKNEIDMDARNSEAETALHIMVQRKRLSPVISLICHGADMNAVNKHGKSPLHYSVVQNDLDIVKALLVLGADPKIKDKEGKTPLDCLDAQSGDADNIEDLFALYDYGDNDIPGHRVPTEERERSLLNEKTGKESLLTLDGGGIRGLILTEMMIAIEMLTQQPIYNLFDWVSGTSTGSYLAVSLSKGRSLRHCQKAYLRLGRSCFTGIRPYPTEMVDQFLLDEFGEENKMNLFTYPRMLIPAVMADRRPAMLHLFRNYDAPYDEHYLMRDARFPRPPVPADQKMWLAIRSSCSAPSYFRSTGRYLDGGLISNNPTLDAMSEIHKYNKYYKPDEYEKEKTLKSILSIGTGRLPLQVLRPIDLYRPSSVWDTPEVMDNLKGFVDLLIDQVSACDNHVLDRAKSWSEMIGAKYFRFNPILQSEVDLNEKDDRLLLSMIIDVKRFIKKNINQLENVAHVLIGES